MQISWVNNNQNAQSDFIHVINKPNISNLFYIFDRYLQFYNQAYQILVVQIGHNRQIHVLVHS